MRFALMVSCQNLHLELNGIFAYSNEVLLQSMNTHSTHKNTNVQYISKDISINVGTIYYIMDGKDIQNEI